MTDDFEIAQGKSASDLFREGLWYVLHTLFALLTLALVVFIISLFHPDSEQASPKIACTFLSFIVPMVVGFIIIKVHPDHIGRYVWISGMLTFCVVCVWVLDLPTGNGLCEKCGAVEKLYRTFFDINHGSGLMGGDGLLVGTWIPLSMIGYALGAKFGFLE